jgi:hypothetical protein
METLEEPLEIQKQANSFSSKTKEELIAIVLEFQETLLGNLI